MNFKVTKEKGSALIEFNIPSKEWEAAIEAIYKKNAKRFNIQGFRKGSAPRKVIERFYGADVFLDDAFDAVARSNYIAALEANEDLFPVDSPNIEKMDMPQTEGAVLTFTMRVTLRPEVTLGKYTGIKVDQVAYNVSDSDIDAEIDTARNRTARLVAVEGRAVQDGDSVNLDYSGSVDGEVFAGGTAAAQTLVIGSKSFIEGFEEQLIGLNIGDERDINVTFPTEYHSQELAGKAAVFKVKINGIETKELPEVNDEFVKDTSKFETVAEYKKDIQERLEVAAKNRADNENRVKMLETVTDDCKMDIPHCMIDNELESMLQEFEQRITMMYRGLKLEDYLKYTNSSVEDYKKQNLTEAERGVRTRLVMQEIIQKEKLESTDEELDVKLGEMAKKIGKKTDDEIAAYKDAYNPERIGSLKSEITVEKLFDFLFKNNTLNVKKAGDTKAATTAKSTAAAEKKPAAKKTTATKAEKTEEASDKPAAKKAPAKKPVAKKSEE